MVYKLHLNEAIIITKRERKHYHIKKKTKKPAINSRSLDAGMHLEFKYCS